MRKNKNLRILIITAVLLLAIASVLFVYRSAAHMVIKNMTAMHVDLDESTDWSGGKSYIKVPYALDSESQYLDLYVPNTATNEDAPHLFVLVHGGGFITNDSQSRQAQLMYRYFRDNGYACATINYRLAQEEPFPGALCDVKAAVRFLKAHADEYGYDAEHIAIWGESAGGYLAVAASVTNDNEFMDVEYIGQKEYEERAGEKLSAKVDICVDYYGAVELTDKSDDWKTLGVPKFVVNIANSWLHTDVMEGYSDVESFWLRKETAQMSEEEKAYSDIYTYVAENISKDFGVKFWIAHGDCDITVPILQSERFYNTVKELLGEGNVFYRVVEGSGHAGDIMYSDEELSGLKIFLDENL
jgi:acetyl esterase/lipase